MQIRGPHSGLLSHSLRGEAQELAFGNGHLHSNLGPVELGAHLFYPQKQTCQQGIQNSPEPGRWARILRPLRPEQLRKRGTSRFYIGPSPVSTRRGHRRPSLGLSGHHCQYQAVSGKVTSIATEGSRSPPEASRPRPSSPAALAPPPILLSQSEGREPPAFPVSKPKPERQRTGSAGRGGGAGCA